MRSSAASSSSPGRRTHSSTRPRERPASRPPSGSPRLSGPIVGAELAAHRNGAVPVRSLCASSAVPCCITVFAELAATVARHSPLAHAAATRFDPCGSSAATACRIRGTDVTRRSRLGRSSRSLPLGKFRCEGCAHCFMWPSPYPPNTTRRSKRGAALPLICRPLLRCLWWAECTEQCRQCSMERSAHCLCGLE